MNARLTERKGGRKECGVEKQSVQYHLSNMAESVLWYGHVELPVDLGLLRLLLMVLLIEAGE